jgi:hypothetical protein
MSFSDLDVLKLVQTREAFDKYYSFILEKAVLEETWLILEGIRGYYSCHPASTEIDWRSLPSDGSHQARASTDSTLGCHT